jgi:hypothetical protein
MNYFSAGNIPLWRGIAMSAVLIIGRISDDIVVIKCD